MGKHPTLPNGFGSIKKLTGNRRNPYAVHPPARERNENGNYIQPTPLCYVPDWYTGFAVLSAYHAGNYKKGMEYEIRKSVERTAVNLDDFCAGVLSNFSLFTSANPREKTFKEVMDAWYDFKHGEGATRHVGHHTDDVAMRYLTGLYDSQFRSLTLDDLQAAVNNAHSDRKSKGDKIVYLKKSSLQHVVRILKEIYAYADIRGLCNKNYAQFLKLPDREAIAKGSPFWDEDLKKLWADEQDPVSRDLLIMCYSGFRISAWETMEINLDELYFKGGIKTAAGRGRIVPIHSGIVHLVREAVAAGGVIGCTPSSFSYRMKKCIARLGISDRSPHDCRHTFSRLCEHYGVPDADRKRLLGHSLAGDLTNGVYGHRTVEELRESIEKIQICR